MRSTIAALLAALGLAILLPAAAAETPIYPPGTFFTLTVTNALDRYHVSAPAQRLGSVGITGLAPGEDIVGIDFRPATGQLYGLGRDSQLYRIDPVTGVATRVGTPFTPALDNALFGFDFNPAVDRIRVVSSTGQNLRLHPDTGQVAGVDGALNPAGTVEAAAYTNNVAGTTSTSLYVIDPGTDQLLLQNPPNNGTLTPVGPLGVNVSVNSGFDIVPGSNAAYAVLFSGSLPSNLYSINLSTGAATLVGALGGGASAARGLAFVAGPETVYGVTAGNSLVRFRSHAPATLLGSTPISGLQPGENVLGIDFRPATGELYGLGSSSRLYRIDTASGAATAVGAGPFTPALSGSDFGFDFNPTVDRIRVVSDAEQNLRLHPDTGTVAFTDSPLNPAGNVVAAAYINNFAGATSTTLFDIDSVTDLLLSQNPPNNGTLNAVGPLGVDAGGLTGFDVAPGGTAFASITPPGGAATNFHTLNLATGAATLVGTIGGGEPIRDIAILLGTEVAYGVTQSAGPAFNLIRFNPATPGVIISSVAVTGLQPGESIFGIDFRPATGELFALGSTSRLYTLNLASGAATAVGSGPFTPALSGTSFGFDFNPTVDRIRVVSDSEQNLRLNPHSGTVAAVDTALAPAGNVVAAAYINNFAFSPTTTLFDIDWTACTLLVQNPPNNGTLTVVGTNLGIAISNANVGFDVASIGGQAYASAYTGGATPGLYRIDLTTGAATLIGNVNTASTLVDFSLQVTPALELFADGFE